MFIGIKYKYFILYLVTIIPVITVDVSMYKELSNRLLDSTYASNIEIVKQMNNALTLLQDSYFIPNKVEKDSLNVIIHSLANSVLGNGNEIFLTDGKQNVIYTTNEHLVKKKLHLQVYDSKLPEGYFTVHYLGVDRKLIYSYNPVTDWYLMVLTPLEITAEKNHYIKSLMTMLIVTTVIVLIVIIFLISSRVTSPISLLKRRLEQLENGNKETVNYKKETVNYKKEVFIKDEIWQIGVSFNHIVSRLEDLIHREYFYKIESNEAKFLALQSQINPHFLHNTLETINSIAIIENVPMISELSRSLSNMFRYNTINLCMFVKVEDEINHLGNYLTVQLIRYDGLIQKRIHIEEDLYKCQITKFVLQPIVENCFIHGFRDLTTHGIITVSGYKENHDIIIQVEDNGVGMDDHEISKINEEMSMIHSSLDHENSSSRNRIGIFNVNNRIKMSFGQEYGVSIEKNNPTGLIVKVRVPLIKNEVHSEMKTGGNHVQNDDC
jgi:sensor histidine kinase YesM